MYSVNVHIKGISPILQHRFAPEILETLMQGTTKASSTPDYSQEWIGSMYVTDDGYLYQPATHVEGALVKATVSFRIKGRGRKTYKDVVRAYCYVQPEQIPHLYHDEKVRAPESDLLLNPTQHLHVNISRVRVQRAAVARLRLEIGKDWELKFTIEVHDDQLRPDVVETILIESGRAGLGDYRPRYGRYQVLQCRVSE